MIRNVQIENFCSFRDSSELNFCTGAKTPTDDSFVPSLTGDKISILAGVFGPNASGKTNLLKSLAFLNFFLRHSYKALEAGAAIPVDTFFGQADHPARLDLEFEGQGEVYRYHVSLTPEAVLEEKLLKRHKTTRAFRSLLTRRQGKTHPILEAGEEIGDLQPLRHLLRTRPNASIVAAGLVTGHPVFQRIDHALGVIETNVDRMGKAEAAQSNRLAEVIECGRYFRENEHFLAQVEAHLTAADLGISRFFIKDVEVLNDKGETLTSPMPTVVHRSGQKEFDLPLTLESSGTKRLFILLRTFLPVLTDGGVAVIDEMESDLHPHLIPLLLDLFVDSATNPKRAQLLFTCHHVEILNRLAKEQIVLVQKDADNVSRARRLSDVKGVRREENFFANYNAGRYEAVPEPALF